MSVSDPARSAVEMVPDELKLSMVSLPGKAGLDEKSLMNGLSGS